MALLFTCKGLKKPNWVCSTQFFDVTTGDLPQIYTETKQVEAPFKYKLNTMKDIRPGNYSLEFVFTYFNGERWVSSTKNINFKVQNFLEKYAISIGVVAGLASVSALIRFAAIPLVEWVIKLLEKVCV